METENQKNSGYKNIEQKQLQYNPAVAFVYEKSRFVMSRAVAIKIFSASQNG